MDTQKKCDECVYLMKVTHSYCYHPDKYGTMLDNFPEITDCCPLK